MFKGLAYNSKTVDVSADFTNSSANALVEDCSKNAQVVNGELRSVRAFKTHLTLPNILAGYEFPDDSGVFCVWNGIYRQRTPRMYQTISDTVFSQPSFLYCKMLNCVLISQPNVGTFCYAGDDSEMVSTDFGFYSMAFCKEHAFGVVDDSLHFSNRANVRLWCGKIQLPARVVAVVEYGDDLVVLGNDIFKVEFSDDLKNTKVTCLCRDVGTVFPRTVQNVKGKLIFLTNRGLCCFSQGKLTRLCEDISFATDNPKAVSTQLDGYWLLFDNSDGERRLLNIDSNGQRIIYETRAVYVYGSYGKIIVVDKIRQVFGDEPAKLYWKSKECDFGNRFEQKYLRKLHVETLNSIDVHLITEHERRIYHVKGGKHTIRLTGTFGKLVVEVHATEETSVKNLSITAQCYGREVSHGYNI